MNFDNLNLFDLNIKDILENWTVVDALRELIANAYDETKLANYSKKPLIEYNEKKSLVTIQDFGRGIKIENFVQNENNEKKKSSNIIGKFGIGLKDAVAVLFRNNKDIAFYSLNKKYTIIMNVKNESISDISTLHVKYETINNYISGTLIEISDIKECDYKLTLENFLDLSNDYYKPISISKYGEIYKKKEKSFIYYNGMKISSDDNLLFSYNLLHSNSTFNKSLNRERKMLSRDSYRELIIKILESTIDSLIKEEKQVILNLIYNSREENSQNEWNYTDIKYLVLTKIDKKILITDKNINPSFKEYSKEKGYELCILNKRDYDNLEKKGIKTLNKFGEDYINNFNLQYINTESLNYDDKENWESAKNYIKELKNNWLDLRNIFNKITFQLIDDHPNALGIANIHTYEIKIVQKIISNKKQLIATLLHEICHLISQSSDVTIKFEETLTECLGILSFDKF